MYQQPRRRGKEERRIALPWLYLSPTMILYIYVRSRSLFISFLQFRNKVSSTQFLLRTSCPCCYRGASPNPNDKIREFFNEKEQFFNEKNIFSMEKTFFQWKKNSFSMKKQQYVSRKTIIFQCLTTIFQL